MENWNTRLETQDGDPLGCTDIRRGIFQGDSLSHLLFVVTLIPLTIMLRKVKSGYTVKNKSKVNQTCQPKFSKMLIIFSKMLKNAYFLFYSV